LRARSRRPDLEGILVKLAIVLLVLPACLAFYTYALYPAILWIIARRARRGPTPPSTGLWPLVTVVMPAYNEERQIAGAIEGILAQDYPADRRQIVIGSDASTDSTDDIVRSYGDRGVELFRMPKRSGKTAIENAACAVIRGDIVVNSDASIRLHSAAVRRLVERFSDPAIGVASGRDVSVAGNSSSNVAEAGYVQYEMRLRQLETNAGGIVGASGCCYAIRADLHRIPIASDLSRDFSAPLTARAHGLQAVSVDDAIAFVPRTASLKREYARKVRTIARGMETLYHARQMMDPMRYGAFAWKLISHKVCRWLLPLTAVPAAIGLLMAAAWAPWARVLAAAAGVVGLAAVVGALWPESRRMPRIVSVMAFGVAANVAVVHAVFRVLSGRDDKVWEPTRREMMPRS
jgi:cellulose synthase/poly-beta-1,6-N-acetylglucosamine synthase-like glycosyltransferase